jgi:branched-subunit amino acid transport protein
VVGVTLGYDPAAVWAAVAAIGALTFLVRVSFIYLFGRVEEIPPRVETALRYVPPAVLAALVAPAFVDVGPTIPATLGNDRLLAGAVATVVAWRTENVVATIAAGMATLWTVGFVA